MDSKKTINSSKNGLQNVPEKYRDQVEIVTVKEQQFHQDGSPVMVEEDFEVVGEDGVSRVETRQVPLFFDVKKTVFKTQTKTQEEIEPPPAIQPMSLSPSVFSSTPTQKPNAFVIKQDKFVVDGVTYWCLDSEVEIQYPPAPTGYETYNSAGGSDSGYINHLTEKSDKYPDADGNGTDAGGDVNEAVSRAFDFYSSNSDFRLGDAHWTTSDVRGTLTVTDGVATLINTAETGSPNYIAKSVVSGIEYEIIVDIKSTNSTVFANSGSKTNIISTTKAGIHKATFLSDGNHINLYVSGVNGEVQINSFVIRPITQSVITSRQDLTFLETFTEKCVTKGVVFPLGWVQYPKDTWNGITLTKTTDVVLSTDAQGVETKIGSPYVRWGDWQAEEDCVSYCAVWDDLTIEQKKLFLSEPKNNLFIKNDTELHQNRYRVKTVKGLGSEWLGYKPYEGGIGVNGYLILGYDNRSNPAPSFYRTNALSGRGTSDAEFSDLLRVDSGNTGAYLGYSYYRLSHSKYWAYHENPTEITIGYNGREVDDHYNSDGGLLCYTPLLLTQRLNQGCHNPLNPFGCAYIAGSTNGTTITGYSDWFSTNVRSKFTSLKDCFIGVENGESATKAGKWIDSTNGVITSTGHISSGLTGRSWSDPYDYHDAISDGQILDLRLQAAKQDLNNLRKCAIRKAVAGEVRGWESLPITNIKTKSDIVYRADESHYLGKHQIAVAGYNMVGTPRRFFVYSSTLGVSPEFIKVGSNNNGWVYNQVSTDWFDLIGSGHGWKGYNLKEDAFIISTDFTTEKFNTLPMTDIIGDPANIKAMMDELNVDKLVGKWIPMIPSSADVATLTKKSSSTSITTVWTNNTGESWSSTAVTIKEQTNSGGGWSHGEVAFYPYSSLANFTESALNSRIFGEVGDVFASNDYRNTDGCRIATSTVGKYLTANLNPPSRMNYHLTQHITWESENGELIEHSSYYPKHAEIEIGTPNNDPTAVKVLSSIIEKNGFWYLQLNGCELKWNQYPTSSYTTVTDPAHNTYEEGQYYLFNYADGASNGGVSVTIPNGLYLCAVKGTAHQSTVSWVINDAGDLTSNGKTFFTFEHALIENPTWGDDQTIPIINNEGTKTDLNGETVKTFCHHTLLPLGVAHNDN